MDNSVRGRLRRLLEKVKKFREKKVEVEPEPQEDKKPSELLIFCISQTTAKTQTFADEFVFDKMEIFNLFSLPKTKNVRMCKNATDYLTHNLNEFMRYITRHSCTY